MMMDLNQLADRVARHEGFVERVYDDATGKVLKSGDKVLGTPTIGYGTTWVTEPEARMLLLSRLEQIEAQVLKTMPWVSSLPQVAIEVLVEMAYQMGMAGLMAFKSTLKAAEEGRWGEMADRMLSSRWALQTPSRALELSKLIRGLAAYDEWNGAPQREE